MLTYNRREDTPDEARLNQDQQKGRRVDRSRRTNPAGKKPGIDANESKEDGNNDGLNCQVSPIQCTYPGVNGVIYLQVSVVHTILTVRTSSLLLSRPQSWSWPPRTEQSVYI
jgi:hypothetical protein